MTNELVNAYEKMCKITISDTNYRKYKLTDVFFYIIEETQKI